MTRINTPGQSIIELIVFPSTKMRENDNNKVTMTALLSTYERAYVFIDVMLCDNRAVFSVCVCVCECKHMCSQGLWLVCTLEHLLILLRTVVVTKTVRNRFANHCKANL